MAQIIDWTIHYVQEHDCDICNKHEKETTGFTEFANIHTHGLDKHGHKELCIPLDIGGNLAMEILNNCGITIALTGINYVPGKTLGVIQNFPVNFYEFEDSKTNTLYMILPDPNGKFPEDSGCSFPYNKQLIYASIIENDIY